MLPIESHQPLLYRVSRQNGFSRFGFSRTPVGLCHGEVSVGFCEVDLLQGYLAHEKTPPPPRTVIGP